VEVKLCPNDGDVYVLARSQGRVQKEQAMRRRVLKASELLISAENR
jgi:hypothetical protein